MDLIVTGVGIVLTGLELQGVTQIHKNFWIDPIDDCFISCDTNMRYQLFYNMMRQKEITAFWNNKNARDDHPL